MTQAQEQKNESGRSYMVVLLFSALVFGTLGFASGYHYCEKNHGLSTIEEHHGP